MTSPSQFSPDHPVPTAQRIFGARDLFSLWFSLGIGLMVLQVGAMLAPGLGLAGAVLAIALGTGVGVLLLGAAGRCLSQWSECIKEPLLRRSFPGANAS